MYTVRFIAFHYTSRSPWEKAKTVSQRGLARASLSRERRPRGNDATRRRGPLLFHLKLRIDHVGVFLAAFSASGLRASTERRAAG